MNDENLPIPGLGKTAPDNAKRLLDHPDETLCFCERIPTRSIVKLLKKTGTTRVQDITDICGAGGGCASCRPDIADLIKALTGEDADMSF